MSQCLDQLRAQSATVPLEILVADNGSTDDSVAWLRREYPGVLLHENANIGFSKANNQLIRRARGSTILLLNNDCILGKDTIATLLDIMDGDERIGLLGCRVLTGEGILQPTFAPVSMRNILLPNPVELYRSDSLAFGDDIHRRFRIMQSYEARHGYDRFLEVDCISAVCVLVRRQVFDTVGMLDENFFMYYEDTDFCLRARKEGWRVMYTPTASVQHLVRRVSKKSSPEKLMTEARLSQYYFVKKHYGRLSAGLVLLRYFLQLLFGILSAIPRGVAALLMQGRPTLGVGWQVKSLRRILFESI